MFADDGEQLFNYADGRNIDGLITNSEFLDRNARQ